MSPLRQAVLERGVDLGIATDGDADRLGIIDDTGAYISPNQVLVLLYEYLLTGKGWTGLPLSIGGANEDAVCFERRGQTVCRRPR